MGTRAKQGESIRARAVFPLAVAKITRHTNQTRLKISSLHGKAKEVAHLLGSISKYLK
jgi:hypothetical protein